MAKRTARPVKPADTAHPAEWDDYDRRVIDAFLREAHEQIRERPDSVPFTIAYGLQVVRWLRGRLPTGAVSRGARI